MTFVRVIETEHCQVEIFQNGNAWAVILYLGFDDIEPWEYSLVVGLEPMAAGATEYYFHIVKADTETDDETDYWSGADTVFFKPEDRRVILETLLKATNALLETAKLPRVEVVTYEANPPEKALVKHFLIGKVFEASGYKVHTGDPYHGKRVWWMERN